MNSVKYHNFDFGDFRLNIIATNFINAIKENCSIIIQSLSQSRAEQVQFQRFLWNKKVSIEKLKESAFLKVKENCLNSHHILCIQDTTELDFSNRENDIKDLGVNAARGKMGLYLHPTLAIDSENDFMLGICAYQDYSFDPNRPKRNDVEKKLQPIETKTSFRWISSAIESRKTLGVDKKITFICDRECDIFEYFARIPDKNTNIIVRAAKIRYASFKNSDEKMKFNELVETLPLKDQKDFNVPTRKSSKTIKGLINNSLDRVERKSKLSLKFEEIVLYAATSRSVFKDIKDPKMVTMTVIEVKEVNALVEEKDLIHWRLITSHKITSIGDAWQIVEWYKKRWHIEQFFRGTKLSGINIENIQVSKGDSIKKLALLGIMASVTIYQLTTSRHEKNSEKATKIFKPEQIDFLKLLNKKYQGATKAQKNPYKKNSVSWCYWVVARMGGWKGYTSHSLAGPKTISKGLHKFNMLYEGWKMAFL